MRRLQLQRRRSEVRRSGPRRLWYARVALLLSLTVGLLVAGVSGQDQPATRRPRPAAPAPVEKTPEPVADYHYDAQGRRDPLKSLVKDGASEERRAPPDPTRPLGPLERFDISALKLVGIVWGELGRKALIKAPDGKSYFATLETYMGKYSGKVIVIESDHLVIEEQYLNAEDKIVLKTLTVPLRRKDKKEG